MNSAEQAVSVLLRLPAATLLDLGRALGSGTLRYGFSQQALSAFAGGKSSDVDRALRDLLELGFTLLTLSILCQSLGRGLVDRDAAERTIDLVLSGPQVVGTPVVDTRTTVMSLFEEAQREVWVTSYVFYQAADIFEKLAQKHDADPAFRVCFLVDLSHLREGPLHPVSLIAKAFLEGFRKNHWPGKRQPQIWHDPRSFNPEQTGGGILHAKTVIIDRKAALITSANFTGAAQGRNIEAGVLIRQPRTAGRLHDYFSGLIRTGQLQALTPTEKMTSP